MAKIIEAIFTRRYNTGDFNYEEHTLTAQVEDGETGTEVLVSLKAEVNAAYTGDIAEVTETKPAKVGKTKKEEKKNGKSKASSTDDEDASDEDSADEDASSDGEGDSDDEAADAETDSDDDDSSDDSEEDDDAKEAPAKKGKTAASSSGTKKGFKKKPQNYNRALEEHKDIFSTVLRSVAPDWKKSPESKAKAKKTSEKMEGVEFLDESGEVLESFKSQVKKLMSAKK